MTPAERIARDVALVRQRYEALRATEGGDPQRLLVVISLTEGSDRHLLRSLPQLLRQTRALGLAIDLLLGCNNGFDAPHLPAFLERNGCRLSEAWCTKSRPQTAAPVVDRGGNPLRLAAGKGEDRCFLVRQGGAPTAPPAVAAGKVRMFNDLFGWVGQSILAGWRPPQFLLVADAEAEFDLLAPWSPAGYGQPALHLLIARLQSDPALHLVGTRNRFVVFADSAAGDRQPCPDRELPPIQLYLNLVHARADGFRWLPGGGMLGRTAAITALYSVITEHYPSAWIDDVMLTALARQAGFPCANEPRVASLNRCPPAADRGAAEEQMRRWLRGRNELAALWGAQAIAAIVPENTAGIVAAGARLFLREMGAVRTPADGWRLLRQGVAILGALPAYRRLARSAGATQSENPDIPSVW